VTLDERVKRFDKAAFWYRLLYKRQEDFFRRTLETNREHLELNPGDKVLDMGCGNASLCVVLAEMGFDVIGIEASHKMLDTARDIRSDHKKKNPFSDLLIQVLWGDVVDGLPANDKSFEVVFIANTAHCLTAERREMMYREAARLAKRQVVVIDYAQNTAKRSRFMDWLDGSDPDVFIASGFEEMRTVFRWVNEVRIDDKLSWYICKP